VAEVHGLRSPSAKGNDPSLSSASTLSSAASSSSPSEAEMISCAASILTWARDSSTSYGPRRQSNEIESFIRRKAAS